MRITLLASACLIGSLLATGAQAASYVTGSGSVSLDRTDDFSWTAKLAATAGSGTDGTTGTITYNFLSANSAGTVWNFSYSVDNTSVAPSAKSELASFGFNSSVAIASAAATGTFKAGIDTGNFNGLGSADVCLYAGSNCNGGASNGITSAASPATGTFSLTLKSGANVLILGDFVGRWQSTGASGNGSASGRGTVVTAVPEPASWAMMLIGFGLVGGAARYRRRSHRVAFG
ncbi:hypothetical protein GCM10011380_32550 [Sphingomonas metalli]|uniref:Ice-binding protein C-terminal domain-containing protein n=1 Tax=Sphingomonas metalli TaxID=1779358 RepID=A0A916TCV1_9SPHN|nr:cistern family PEP-CTERM protein [Sphingomonas metalli]GGB40572.1 hypothetical protein GCM10011380_32550 [Sphingomonas metalli]